MASYIYILAAALPLALAQSPTASSTAHASAAPSATSHPVPTLTPAEENTRLCKYTAATWLGVVAVLLAYRWTQTLLRHVRRLSNLNHDGAGDGRQKFFIIPNERFAKLKRHLINAPLIGKRHSREIKISAALGVGIVPGRLPTLFLLGYLALNVAFCSISIPWHNQKLVYSEARNRFGVMAVLNMIPLFLLAGRNNPLIWLLGISFNSYNLVHRWLGRIVVLEAVAHAAFWLTGKVVAKGENNAWALFRSEFLDDQLIKTGTIALLSFMVILLQSPAIVRHAFYETFLHVHIVLVITATATVYIHLETLSQQVFVKVAIACWVVERAFRMSTLIRNNARRGVTKAEVEALPGEAMRVILRVANPWKFQPGQHIFLYMPSVGLWQNHPFSVAWSEDSTYPGEKGPPLDRDDIESMRKATSVSLIIRRRTGFTDRMYKKADKSPGGKLFTTAFVEGPYGGQSFQSYGTVMLFAAGVGITHQVPHVRDLVAAYADGTCATRKVTLVWIIQSPEHLEWIRPWMTQILAMEHRRDILKILLFVTRPRSTKEIHSPSSSVQMFPGKPDVGALIDKEQAQQIGAMAVSVCGTGSLSDDVRKATRDRCEKTEIDFFSEEFTW